MRAIYESGWHSPALCWLLGLLTLGYLAPRLARGRTLEALCAVFTVEIMLDAWITGYWPPLAPTSPWGTPLAIAFVILGDLRYFLLVERWSGKPLARALAVATAWSLVVPLASQLLRRASPATFADLRALFLGYEAMFAVLAGVLRFVVLPRRFLGLPAPIARYLLLLTTFELAQYVLWALSDVIILGGHEVGYLLRLVPNTMYYGLFVPFALWKAPAEVRA